MRKSELDKDILRLLDKDKRRKKESVSLATKRNVNKLTASGDSINYETVRRTSR